MLVKATASTTTCVILENDLNKVNLYVFSSAYKQRYRRTRWSPLVNKLIAGYFPTNRRAFHIALFGLRKTFLAKWAGLFCLFCFLFVFFYYKMGRLLPSWPYLAPHKDRTKSQGCTSIVFSRELQELR